MLDCGAAPFEHEHRRPAEVVARSVEPPSLSLEGATGSAREG
jgi:hypothetical protein